MEDAGVLLAEALVERDDLGSHPLVHRHVRHGRQQPAVTQLTLHHKKQGYRLTDPVRIRVGSGFNWVSGSGSRRTKITHKSTGKKNLEISCFLKCWMFSF